MPDGFEDLGGAEVGDQKAKLKRRMLLRGLLDIGAGAGAARDETLALQRLECLGDGDARGLKTLTQGSFRRKTFSGFVEAVLNFGKQRLVDGAVPRYVG